MIDPGLQDRVPLITGGNHGSGATTAQALAACRASLVVTYLRLHHAAAPPPTGNQHDHNP